MKTLIKHCAAMQNGKGSDNVTEFVKAKEVCEILQCSSAMAYRIIARLNKELETKGYITISGRISKSYLYERMGIKEYQEERKPNGSSTEKKA